MARYLVKDSPSANVSKEVWDAWRARHGYPYDVGLYRIPPTAPTTRPELGNQDWEPGRGQRWGYSASKGAPPGAGEPRYNEYLSWAGVKPGERVPSNVMSYDRWLAWKYPTKKPGSIPGGWLSGKGWAGGPAQGFTGFGNYKGWLSNLPNLPQSTIPTPQIKYFGPGRPPAPGRLPAPGEPGYTNPFAWRRKNNSWW